MAENKTVPGLDVASSAATTDLIVVHKAGVGTVKMTVADFNKLFTFLGLTDSPANYVGDAGKVPVVNSGETALEFAVRLPPLLHVRDEKSAGTKGGTAAVTTWNVRDLNTVVTNEISGASLASNQITLPAGTYEINANAPGFDLNRSQLRLYNTTDSSITLYGQNGFVSGASGLTIVHIFGRFTIAAEKVFELQHWSLLAQADDGLGNAVNNGGLEVYADVRIEKISG